MPRGKAVSALQLLSVAASSTTYRAELAAQATILSKVVRISRSKFDRPTQEGQNECRTRL
jgi:hypothetical protein